VNKRAFTLIELLIVLAIFSLVLSLGYPQVKRVFRSNLKSAAAQMAGMVRYGYDISVIKGRIHRIAFDFDKSVYRLEVSNTDELVSLEEETATQAEEKKKQTSLLKEEPQKAPAFSPSEGEAGKDRKLPPGITFDSVENISTKQKKTTDFAYLYFFPAGLTEDVIIRFNGEKNNTGFYSLRVNPANAKTVIEGRYLEAE
jgi:prepilin-type N-terminal cleavage/methylation domain-containing protein